MRTVLLAIACALALTGCKTKCRQLSEKLCDCAVNSAERDNCLRRASNAETINPPNATDEAYCESLLPVGDTQRTADGGQACDCRLIDTAQGKVNCGLARPAP